MSDQQTDVAPTAGEKPRADDDKWSIKNVPTPYRDKAKAAAKRNGQNLGEWLCETILWRTREEQEQKRDVAVVETPSTRLTPAGLGATGGNMDMSEAIGQMMNHCVRYTEATRAKLPRSIARSAGRLIQQQMEVMSTLLPPLPGKERASDSRHQNPARLQEDRQGDPAP